YSSTDCSDDSDAFILDTPCQWKASKTPYVGRVIMLRMEKFLLNSTFKEKKGTTMTLDIQGFGTDITNLFPI
ncbi:MAG: hypothetical protein ACQJCO_04380, partial [cyanobacterium endosymbiont of Rhopalodia sterrenbergii]